MRLLYNVGAIHELPLQKKHIDIFQKLNCYEFRISHGGFWFAT